jgi:hypothetical protein
MALAESQSLQKLQMDCGAVSSPSARAMGHLWRVTTCLQDLYMEMGNFERAEHIDQLFLAESFGSNRSLVTLYLHCGDTGPGTATQLVLQHLGAQNSTLRTLILQGEWNGRNRWYSAMGQFIGTTCALQDLEIRVLSFTKEDENMEVLVNALMANSSLTTLKLSNCRMDVDASRLFIQFVQQHCNRGGNRVRELHLTECFMHNRALGGVAATMLIDSKLELLHLQGNGSYCHGKVDYVSFFGVLSAHTKRIQLPRLKLGTLSREEVMSMLRYMETSVHLRELSVHLARWLDGRFRMRERGQTVCRALFHCASLHRVELWNDGYPRTHVATMRQMKNVASRLRSKPAPSSTAGRCARRVGTGYTTQ